MNIYFSSRDMLPLWRVDVSTLFGKYISRHGCIMNWFVLGPHDATEPEWLKAQKSKVFLLRNGRGHALRKYAIERLRDIYVGYKIMENKPDLVIIRDDYVSLIITGFFCWIRKVPCIFWMSFLMEDGFSVLGKQQKGVKGRLKVIYGKIYSRVGRVGLKLWASHLFVQSEQMEHVVRERGLYNKKITSVHMAVDFEEIESLSQVKIDRRRPTIGYCGAISIHRGIESVFLALEKLKNNNMDVCFHVVGWFETNEDKVFFTTLINKLGLSNSVIIHGRLPWAQGCQYMSACDVCISPIPDSKLFKVGSPTKLFEYMALSKPIIASKHPFQSQVIEEAKCGWLCELTAESVADAIKSAFSSRDRFKEIGESGRHYALKLHSYEKRSDEVYSVLKKLQAKK